MTEPEAIINPSPKIHTLICTLPMIDSENQIRYIMQKFTNLQLFRIRTSIRSFTIYSQYDTTIVLLLRFVMTIPYFRVEIPLEERYLAKAWIELINMNDIYRNVEIIYRSSGSISTELLLEIEKTSSIIDYSYNDNVAELPLSDFFFEGRKFNSNAQHRRYTFFIFIQLCF